MLLFVCLFVCFKPNKRSPEASHSKGEAAMPPGHTGLGEFTAAFNFVPPSLLSCDVQPVALILNTGFQKRECYFSEDTRRGLISDFFLVFLSYICFWSFANLKFAIFRFLLCLLGTFTGYFRTVLG